MALARDAVAESARHIPFSEARVRATFASYLEGAHPTIFVAEVSKRIVGFLNATISGYTFADGLYTTQEVLYVEPAHRGTRAAAAALLLERFVQWSDKLGALEATGGNDNGLTDEATAKLLGRFGFENVGHFMRRTAASG